MSQADANSITEIAEQGRIEHTFSTPVFSYIFKDVDSLNVHLRKRILEKERGKQSIAKSNQGGWQSSPDLFSWGGSEIALLEDYIHRVLKIATAHLHIPQSIKTGFDVYAWAAVNRQGHYNTTHVHPMATWSGIYYVDPGDEAPDEPGAALELSHPVLASVMTFFSGILPSARLVQPQAGMVILFPSYLQHSVRMYHGERPRICVPFNAHLRIKGT